VDLVDPATGETYKAAHGHNYYWRQPHTGAVVGTQTADPPRPDVQFEPLREW
jgi:hypothetical protein